MLFPRREIQDSSSMNHHIGTKFVLLTSLTETTAESVLQKVYEAYADAVMKNPFHTPEMPIRSDGFDSRITTLIGSGQT